MEEFMYRVIEMYGECEPWWFLEGWEDDIVSSRKFEDYYQALKYYKQKWLELNEHFPSYKSRKIPKRKLRPGYEKERGSRKHRSCQYTLDSKKGTTLS